MFHTLLDPGTHHGVGVAFTDRHDGVSKAPLGSLNLGRTDADDPRATRENFRRLRSALGLRATVTVHQVHGTEVVLVDRDLLGSWHDGSELGDAVPGGSPLRVADALVTTEPLVGLCVRVADCVPVLLSDATAHVVGAAHAGRVGLATGVLEATVAAMRRLGAASIVAHVGPAVCGSCYEVPEAMRAEVAAAVPETWAVSSWGTPALDLPAGTTAVLERLDCRVVAAGACTRESPDLHSHRRDGDAAGRLAGICWLS